MSPKQFCFIVALSLCYVLPGCSDGRPERVPVSGKVLIDGKPLAVGAVRFTPQEGRPATGKLAADGSFTLTTFETGDGAVPGLHKVTVHAVEELPGGRMRWNVPKMYESASTSGLTRQIDGPTDSVVIELTWGGQKGPFIEVAEGAGEV